jgi:hypothetical protein
MVLRLRCHTVCALFLAALLLPLSLGAQEKPRPGEVTLPLADYLSLVDAGDRAQSEQAARVAQREPAVAEVTAQRVSLVMGEDVAEVAAELEVLIRGTETKPVFLPFSGYPSQIEVKAISGGTGGAAATAVQGGGGAVLLAPAAGKYTVRITGRAPLGEGGIQRLALAPVVAPVAAIGIELAADLAWSCSGAVVVEDRWVDDQAAGVRRHVELAARRGERQVLELRRKVDSAEAEKLLAQTVVLTLFQLRPEGPRRHDVVLYEVSRGSLGSFTVALPPGLEVEQAGTDEGAAVPVIEGGTLTVHRQRQLQGIGYLVLTSTPSAAALAEGAPLAAVQPAVDVRLRYLALASSVAADARPLPEASWSRVDLTDLPAALSEALAALDLTAAWRLAGEHPEDGAGARLAVTLLPAAPSLDATILLRDTTTLMTVDGTLLYRDRFTLESKSRAGASLDLTLPAGATLWSAKVDEQPVRPLERGGALAVPLGFESGAQAVVEVVAVLERAIPPGRSTLALELPQVRIPVREHRLKLLLPEGPRYRFRGGDLRPAAIRSPFSDLPVSREPWQVLQSTPGVLTDRINVGGNESGAVGAAAPAAPAEEPQGAEDAVTVIGEAPLLDQRRTEAKKSDKRKDERERDAGMQSSSFALEAQGLKQGLVGGVKPLPISIPESGKVLLLTGVLPPQKVAVELEVKAKR